MNIARFKKRKYDSKNIPHFNLPDDRDQYGNCIYSIVGYELVEHKEQDPVVVEDIERQINLRLAEIQS